MIAPVAVRAGIHGGNQLEIDREGQRAAGAVDRHDVVFEFGQHRLAAAAEIEIDQQATGCAHRRHAVGRSPK